MSHPCVIHSEFLKSRFLCFANLFYVLKVIGTVHCRFFFCERFSSCVGSLGTRFIQQLGLPRFKTEAVWKLQPFQLKAVLVATADANSLRRETRPSNNKGQARFIVVSKL